MQSINDNDNLWYNNPIILFKNLDQFYPHNELFFFEKINSIARLALYLIIIIIMFSLNKKIYLVSFGLLIFSYYYSIYTIDDNFSKDDNILNQKKKNQYDKYYKCSKPTLNNPFMNHTFGEQYTSQINNSIKYPACSYEDVKNDMKKKFKSTIHNDLTDIWGKYISDRNFYTMPNTNIVNNQVNFAKWCYSSINSGECKTYGSNCIKYQDPKYRVGRYSY